MQEWFLGEEKGKGYFSDTFNGRPRLLSADSIPETAAILACHSSLQTVVAYSRLCAVPCEEIEVSGTIVDHARSCD